LKKALAIAEATSMLTLADDSGLEVDALGGRPGLFSARFAGEHATDQQNRAALLAELAGVDDAARTARFRCVLALVARGEAPIIVEGTCEGRITRAARGASGFGYDPLFWVSSEDATMAELTEERKNQLSHRGRAAAALRPLLDELLSRT
jgi:XTP/dITP diphosphohydrolase